MSRTSEGTLMTEIILEIFKLNGLLVLEGDQLTKEFKLTSARWKILGALAGADQPMTVPDIAKTMGQTRQAVQRLVNEMQEDGLLTTQINPHHKRAKLQVLTEKGKTSFEVIQKKQAPWVNAIAAQFSPSDLKKVNSVLTQLINTLES